MKYRYYSTQRPVDIGTFPTKETLLGIVNYNYKREVHKDIWAWGFIDYSEELAKEEKKKYELNGAWIIM